MRILIGNLKSENEVLKRLLKDRYVLINYDSIDCDGCSTSKVLKFYNLESIYKAIEDEAEVCDGFFSYSIPFIFESGNLYLNKPYNGGQWSN